MRTTPLSVALALAFLIPFAVIAQEPAVGNDAGFVPIFDGKSLDGWQCYDMSFWSVEDGAITGTVTKDHLPRQTTFLCWQKGKVEDFELKFKFRIFGEKANSGMQIRSELKPNNLVYGYQADMSGNGLLVGSLYDEFGPRHSLAARGQISRFDPSGKKTVTPINPDAADPLDGDKKIDPTQWNEYHILAQGEQIVIHINGIKTAELFDGDKKRQRLSGILAMPVIAAEMKVQFKEIRLKQLEKK
jgi:hypothetical protein